MNDFEKAMAAIDKAVKDTHRKVNFSVYKAITEATPKLSGLAQNNWFPSIGNPSREKTSSTSGNFGASESTANNGIEGYQRTYITNNLPYIRRLNEGHSKKAAPNFVERHVNLVARQNKK